MGTLLQREWLAQYHLHCVVMTEACGAVLARHLSQYV